jgi:glutathione synthase/RimK-type ligase-like ATP-grasp enzyme
MPYHRPMRIALVSCTRLSKPDEDEEPLVAALHAAGVEVAVLPWDRPDVDWSAFDAAVLRSTWNYHRAPAAFLDWLDATAAVTALHNPAPIARWNAHKRYLLDLAEAGVAVTPTVLLRAGDSTPLAAVLRSRGWDDVVVKPAISAGSFGTRRVRPAESDAGEAHLRGLLATEDALIQPYLPSVEGHGERALVWIAGEVTHAVRKRPRFAGDGESVTLVPVEPDERDFAVRVLAPYAASLLYARVDMARDATGRPCLMELELIEPSLFLRRHPPALERLAAAIARLPASKPARSVELDPPLLRR